jgi:hypothetical protein
LEDVNVNVHGHCPILMIEEHLQMLKVTTKVFRRLTLSTCEKRIDLSKLVSDMFIRIKNHLELNPSSLLPVH